MRLVVRVLGSEVLDVELGPSRREPAAVAPVAPPCRYEKPERPTLEATGGGQFEMGFQPSVSWSPTEQLDAGP